MLDKGWDGKVGRRSTAKKQAHTYTCNSRSGRQVVKMSVPILVVLLVSRKLLKKKNAGLLGCVEQVLP